MLSLFIIWLNPLPQSALDALNNDKLSNELLYSRYTEEYHLNKPIFIRVLILFSGYFKGDFGNLSSLNNLINVTKNEHLSNWDYFFVQNKVSYLIAFISVVISLLLGYLLGFYAAVTKYAIFDYLINTFIIVFISISPILFIPVLNLIRNSYGEIIKYDPKNIKMFIFAVFALVLITLVSITQIIRNQIKQILKTNYYKLALIIAKNKWIIFWKYIFKNSLYTLLDMLPFLVVGLFSMSIFLEIYFDFPGNWSKLYTLILLKESSTIIFIFFSLAFVYTLVYIFKELIKEIFYKPLSEAKVYE
ncbi:ABC transporter permease subunit [Mycoplasmopsis ciconiae]|uniref:ABC transporter permease subunit n=1 Tax=Mycoplasmopsis ciconiae TaxID=561067 RepID=A0ABU7MKU4_9BACT|nr:ABC transporter permease subunit [Mycoplasmopsis ciconiae]